MSWMNALSAPRRDPVQRAGWQDDPVTERDDIPLLRAAAARFDARSDSFAQGKGQACRDLAAKLEMYGSYVSTKQADFARKLIAWSQPRQEAAAPAPAPVAREIRVDNLHRVLQNHARFYVGLITISRRNADQLCWIKHDDCEQVIGKIDGGVLSLFDARIRNAGLDRADILCTMLDLDNEPLEAAKRYGKATGRCCSCGRELTDPTSISLGIGPICAEKF